MASEKITYYWVGEFYSDSIILMKILILCTVFVFVNFPASFYFNSKTKYKFIYLLSIIIPLSFVISFILLVPNFGLLGIVISKFIAVFIGFLISMVGISQIYNPIISFKKWFINLSIMCLFISYVFPLIINNFFISQEKSSLNLVILLITLAVIIVLSYFLLLLTKQQQRNDLKYIWNYICSIYSTTSTIKSL